MLRMSESIFEFAVQDILHKILSFSVQLFAYNVILRNIIWFSFNLCLYGLLLIWQGRFEILCLSGSYLVLDDGGTRTRSGGLCIALCGPDHRVIGGSVGGVLTAAGTVQVISGVSCHKIVCACAACVYACVSRTSFMPCAMSLSCSYWFCIGIGDRGELHVWRFEEKQR